MLSQRHQRSSFVIMFAAAKHSWANGSLLIGVGGLATFVAGVGLVMMEDETKLRKEASSQDRWQGVAPSSVDGRSKSSLPATPSNAPTSDPVMYRATVNKVLGAAFDGPVALKNLSPGQEVGVVEEGLGPKQRYHRARSFGADDKPLMEGWYPKEFLDRVEVTK